MKDDMQAGTLHGRQLMPESWFDRYQASWQYMVVRPRPQLSLTIVSQQEPPKSFVEVEQPHQTKGSPEAALWAELVHDLEEAMQNAADASVSILTSKQMLSRNPEE